MRSNGELVRRGSITDGGDVEFWETKGMKAKAGEVSESPTPG